MVLGAVKGCHMQCQRWCCAVYWPSRWACETSAGPHLRLALGHSIARAARALGKRRAHSLCGQAMGSSVAAGGSFQMRRRRRHNRRRLSRAPPTAHLPPHSWRCSGRWRWLTRCSLGGGGGCWQLQGLEGSCRAPAAGLPTQASWRCLPALEWSWWSGDGLDTLLELQG